MRITSVSPAPAYRQDLRRSESGSSSFPYRERLRFSAQDVIFDLSAEAISRTGRNDLSAARRRHMPPDTYDRSGELAYYDPPVARLAFEPEAVPERPDPEPVPAPVTVVAFDGMLRSPAAQQISLPRSA